MKHSLALFFVATLLASPLAAQDVGAQIADQLRAQGYEDVEVSKTWLGRLRIDARGAGQRREIIVNPRTGEILRDFLAEPSKPASRGVQILERPASGPALDRREGRPSGPAAQGGGREGPGAGPAPGGPSR